ncbi:MAG: dockerin type I repeat-containing protein [Ruminococcus sp.]|nr:dockerin type I repeat-containing protein [Ruminococcus sp.]
MKKRLLALFSILLVISLLSTVTAFAGAVPDASIEEAVGRIDIADVGSAPESGSYILTDDGETVLEVKHVEEPGLTAALNDTTANGYYTAEFMLPETNYRVFLTGLTQNNVSEIQQAIIEAYTEGEDFDLKNLGFIDAEKTWPDDGDENLCWAASTSNLLTYTGWASQAGFDSTDDVFEAFINAFTDAGGNIHYGTGWFFNGVSAPGGAQPTAGTGRYLPQYNYEDMTEQYDLYEDCAVGLSTVYDKLRDGYGVSLSVDIYGSEGYEGGHAITCWGFVTDIRYPEDNKNYYRNVIITDSDSHKYWVKEGMDRRDADDVMSLFALTPVEQEGIDTYQFQITDQQIGIITEAYTLLPYSADVPYETDMTASMDLSADYDLMISPLYLSTVQNAMETVTVFTPDDTIYNQPRIYNNSELTFPGSYSMKVTVTDAQGNVKYTKNYSYASYNLQPGYDLGFGGYAIGKLPVGDYTITAEFNPNRTVKEAYYFNNTTSIAFKVRERYLIGDTDGSGTVDSIDAAAIQRILAKLPAEVTDSSNLTQRGDISRNGALDLMDVTFLQRYLANMTVNYPVNVSRFYD